MAAQLETSSPSIAAMEAAFVAHVEMEQRRGVPQKRDYVYASARRHCLRRMVFEASAPELMPDFKPEQKARMMRGKQRERDIVIDMQRAGRLCEPQYEFVGQQEAVKIYDRHGRLTISGKIDGRILWADGTSWPAEIKDWAPTLTERIDTFADLFESPWTWSGAHQILAYLYSKPEPIGVLVLPRPGLPKFIEVRLEEHLPAMEAFLRDAEDAKEHLVAGTLPDYTDDAEECKRCPMYGGTCNPPLRSPGAAVLTDPELIAMLDRREELKDSAIEFDHLDAAVKEQIRGVESGVAGSFMLQGKWGKSTTYEIPDEIKAQYRKEDPKGRFTMKITRL